MRWSTFQKYLLPGFVFQSVIIAGGYGTGREIVEFFLSYGPLPGLLGMVLITTVIFSLVAAISYELARRFRLYDYRSFFKRLLGPAWVLFELAYITLMFLVIDPYGHVPDYSFALSDVHRRATGTTEDSETAVLGIVTLPRGKKDACTVNLQAPLFIDFTTRRGWQLVLAESAHDTRHAIDLSAAPTQ